jgi:hypothetical protein
MDIFALLTLSPSGNLGFAIKNSPAIVGPKISEHLEVPLKHRPGPRPHSVFLGQIETR